VSSHSPLSLKNSINDGLNIRIYLLELSELDIRIIFSIKCEFDMRNIFLKKKKFENIMFHNTIQNYLKALRNLEQMNKMKI
jgi:hypothetical protein